MKELRVTRASKIFSDGRHNAFTSIARFGGVTYIAFRSATTHLAFDGKIVILRSQDNSTWSVAARIGDSPLDFRDPRLIVFKGRLHLYFFARNPENKIIPFLTTSVDGIAYDTPRQLEQIPLVWGLTQFDGLLYGSSYEMMENVFRPALYSSSDGETWEKKFTFPFMGTETAIDFDENGTLWALVRDSCYGCIPTLCSLNRPYVSLPTMKLLTLDLVKGLSIRIQGPMLKRLDGACVIVARRWDGGMNQRRNLRSDVFMIEDGQDIRFVCTLPSGGDTSYASWLSQKQGHALVSYYSSHEHKMDESFETEAQFREDPAHAEHSTAADIFLAEFSFNF